MEKRTWMPTTAGILDIVSGICGLFGGFVLGIATTVTRVIPQVPHFVPGILAALTIPLTIVGILAIVGGIYAIQRKIWGLAIAGAIASLFTITVLGIASIVLTAVAQKEFE